jgi:DNA-binding NarL/FixJ family response regulator
MSKLRVLLADDHAVVREGLKALVNSQEDMEVVGEAADGRDAWEQALTSCPDVAVMDLSMPELGGAEATAMIRRGCPGTRVLALTVHESEGYMRQCLAAGASGYLLKRAAADELVRAIREVAAGGVCIDPKMAGQAVATLTEPSASEAQHDTPLTERETEIVKLLARGHINREIADQLSLSVKTIEVYKARALEKLGLRSRADLVHYAAGQGWIRLP